MFQRSRGRPALALAAVVGLAAQAEGELRIAEQFLALALLWFGLGKASLVFVLVHSVLWPLAIATIFQNRSELYTDKVYAGLISVILIGLLVENLGFDTLERLTVRRWGMQR